VRAQYLHARPETRLYLRLHGVEFGTLADQDELDWWRRQGLRQIRHDLPWQPEPEVIECVRLALVLDVNGVIAVEGDRKRPFPRERNYFLDDIRRQHALKGAPARPRIGDRRPLV